MTTTAADARYSLNRRMTPMRTNLSTALLLSLATGLEAQRGSGLPALSPPSVSVYTTPMSATVAWKAVVGAAFYTVEQASSPAGPWTPVPMKSVATDVTVPSSAGVGNGYGGGALYYYRVTAFPPLGPRGEQSLTAPGVSVVPRITPKLDSPLGIQTREDGADLWVSWEPVPFATSYLVTAAMGQGLPPTHTVEVSAQSAEARLVNVALPTTPLAVWVAVNARYGNGVLAPAVRTQVTIPAVEQCWPSSSVPMSAPTVLVGSGPTSVSIGGGSAVKGQTTARVERAPMGPQPVWQAIGCKADWVVDASLTPGIQYQYRVTEVGPFGTLAAAPVGQTIVVAATGAAPDNQTPTATVSGCNIDGCLVTLNWMDYPGNLGVRIESSYGLSQVFTTNWAGKGWNGPTTGSQPNVVLVQPSFSVPLPKGGYSFSVTALYRPMRPSGKPPGQVTVVVP